MSEQIDYVERLRDDNHEVFAGDTEFSNRLLLPDNYSDYKTFKKILCRTTFVLTQIARYKSNVVVYEHPDVGKNLLSSWDCNCVLSHYLGFKEVSRPKNKNIKTFNIAYLFYFSSYDLFGLFRSKDTQIMLAKQLLGGRVVREKSFPNHLKTGVFIEVPVTDGNGKESFEVREIAIKLYDAKGYTPAGVSGLNKTFETWGVKYSNKNWTKYFDISNFLNEYTNTIEMVEITLDDGSQKWMSKHDICVAYASGDGIKEMFELYNNIHMQAQKTLDKMKLSEYNLKNFGTIGNWSNQVGVAACLRGLSMGFTNKDEVQLAKYFYHSSAYALLDECHPTVKQLLNVDGGYCKNMKPTFPVIKDLVLDMDLSGAYCNCMRSLPYCVGIPCVISYPLDRPYRANFKKEHDKLIKKNLLYPSAWVARVSTTEPLSFNQDLIFSKIFGETDFEKSLIDDGDGFFVIDDGLIDEITDKKILSLIPDGSFQLLNNEITSGILTHDLLQFILIYWSKSEQKELFNKLQIEALIFYKKSHLLDTISFKDEYQKLDNAIIHDFTKEKNSTKDNRKPIWTIIETNDGWFGDLSNIRDLLKNYSKSATRLLKVEKLNDIQKEEIKVKLTSFLTNKNLLDEDKQSLEKMLLVLSSTNKITDENISVLNNFANKYNCEQNGFKNVNNSSYGVSGSAFYQTEKPKEYLKKNGSITSYGIPKIGNIVFAQNTTARVRLGAYCMVKGLNGYPIITDGTPSNINQVWLWEWKSNKTNNHFGSDYLWKLSRYNAPNDVDPKGRNNVKLLPLGGNKWEVIALDEKSKSVTISNSQIQITGCEENWSILDEMAYNHVKNLFGELDIFKNDIMKYASKDLFKGAAFQSQANYLFEAFFDKYQNVTGNYTAFKTKARGYNLSKVVYRTPNLNDDGVIHPYENMILDIYEKDEANIYIKSVFSPQLLGIDDFNKSDTITNDYINRGFLPHSPTYRSSKPSPFSLSMFRWNTRKQYKEWDTKVESWKRKTGFGMELLFLTEEMVINRTPLCYSDTVRKIQEMIDENISLNTLDKRVSEKLKVLKHPQLELEESYQVDNT